MSSKRTWQSAGFSFLQHTRQLVGTILSGLVSALVLLWLLFAGVVLLLRYAVLPGIDSYRAEIEALASRTIGLQVSIARVEAGWDGLRPELRLKGVRVHDRQGGEALSFRTVDAVIAWQSVVLLEPSFHRLHAEGPVLHAERTTDGSIFVAGFPFAPQKATDPALVDWVLGQERISVTEATLVWKDALRGATELRLEQVALLLENDADEHRFGLSAVPAATLAGPIELRGDLNGATVTRPGDWNGRFYASADAVDLAAWSHWIDWPVRVARGHGSLRAWATLAAGRPGEVSVDLALTDVEATLAEDLPTLDLIGLSGRLTLRREAPGQAAGAQRTRLSGLDVALALRSGATIRPTGFLLQWSPLPEGGTQGLGVLTEADLGELAAVAGYLPFDPASREALQHYAPSGTLRDVQISWAGRPGAWRAYSLKTEFSGLRMAAAGRLPGFDGLAGTLTADEKGGALHVDNGPSALDFPAVFPAGLSGDPDAASVDSRILLDELAVDLNWTVAEPVDGGRPMEFTLQKANFSGPAGAGEAHGSYRFVAARGSGGQGRGAIDLGARLVDADAASLWRYLPGAVPAKVRQWLKGGLRAGLVESAELTLRGPLDAFPFPDDAGGRFLVKARVKDGELRYHDAWPAVTGIDADLTFAGSSLDIVARRAGTAGMALAKAEVRIGDFSAASVPLVISGEAQGPVSGFTGFLDASPLGETLGNFYDSIRLSGDGRLKLDLAIPLDKPEKARVKGLFDLSGGQVRIDPMLPPVTQVGGRVAFSENSAQALELAGTFLGRPLAVALRADGKEVRVAASGEASVDQFKQYYYGPDGTAGLSGLAPLVDRLSGTLPWQAAVSVKGGRVRIGVESSLEGLASTLPAPLTKSAERALPVRFERIPLPSERRGKVVRDEFKVGIGDLVRATLVRRHETTAATGGALGHATVERGLLIIAENAGKAPESSAQPDPGLRVVVRQAAIDLDAWRAVLARPEGGEAAPPVANAGADDGDIDWPTPQFDIEAKSLRLIGRQWRDVKLSARPRKGGMSGRVEARDTAGSWEWESAGKGAFRARLAKLVLPEEKPVAGATNGNGNGGNHGGATATDSARAPDSLPALDVVAEEFVLGSHSLGKIELQAENEANTWKVSRFALNNPDGRVAASGRWTTGSGQRSEAEFTLEAGDIGRFLGRFGYPDAIRKGEGSLTGRLAWRGSPLAINQPSLSGTLRLKAETGQFNKLEPGFGKLLSLLSLQTLPRRVALDFRDVFSEGFAFDEIAGTTDVAEGVMRTSDLVIEGAQAKVLMRGEVDLGRDTQDVRVIVQPQIGGSVALGAALVVNPVAGVAALVAQKVFKDPLNKAFAFEYHITGSLTDPKVEQVGGKSAPSTSSPYSPPSSAPAPEKK